MPEVTYSNGRPRTWNLVGLTPELMQYLWTAIENAEEHTKRRLHCRGQLLATFATFPEIEGEANRVNKG